MTAHFQAPIVVFVLTGERWAQQVYDQGPGRFANQTQWSKVVGAQESRLDDWDPACPPRCCVCKARQPRLHFVVVSIRLVVSGEYYIFVPCISDTTRGWRSRGPYMRVPEATLCNSRPPCVGILGPSMLLIQGCSWQSASKPQTTHPAPNSRSWDHQRQDSSEEASPAQRLGHRAR